LQVGFGMIRSIGPAHLRDAPRRDVQLKTLTTVILRRFGFRKVSRHALVASAAIGVFGLCLPPRRRTS